MCINLGSSLREVLCILQLLIFIGSYLGFLWSDILSSDVLVQTTLDSM